MPEDLQPLIDRIQKDAVEKAEAEAEDILSKAREKAASIVQEAEEKKKAILAQAEKDARIYEERSRKTLEQAARDLLITVSHAIEDMLSSLVSEAVEEAMSIEVLQQMMVKMAERCAAKEGESRIELIVSPKDKEKLIHFFANLYQQKMIHGVQLKTDADILKGFRVSFKEDHVYLDFTSEAVAEALTNFLRPHLQDIVKQAADQTKDIDTACHKIEKSVQE